MAQLGSNTSGHLFDTSFNTEGVLYSAASGVVTSTASGSSGQLLQSAGNASPPAYTTATFPATATSTGTILRADGTNWSASTNTYPNTATQGDILIATGSNVIGSLADVAVGQVLTSGGVGANPAYSATLPTAVQGNITQTGALASGSLTTGFTAVNVAQGGTGRATLTNHGVLVGAATSAITQLAAGTAGQVLQSGGASADPAYSTATYPTTSGTSGTLLSSNGTNFVNTTATFPTASGGSGKILYDNGTNFVESTPTFPASASATSRKIIVSDGTNWTASTETWATPGSSGNVLTSDGTNWTSAAATGVSVVSGQLTNTQVKNLHGTPVQIIAAPGAGKVIQIIGGSYTMNYGGNNVFTAAAGQTIQPFYGTIVNASAGLLNANITNNSSTYNYQSGGNTGVGGSVVGYSVIANTAVNLYNSTATEISGNAANDNTVSYNIIYRTITIP